MRLIKKHLLKIFTKLKYISFRLLAFTGILLIFLVIFAFTSGPFWLRYRLGTQGIEFGKPPMYIILLGGGGMPSGSALMRTYYTAKLAGNNPKALVIIAMTGDTTDSLNTVIQMKHELMLRQVSQKRLMLEYEGVNTRSQAMNVSKMIPDSAKDSQIVLVTSPEHMRRSLLCFKKVGFKNVGGFSTFDHVPEADLSYNNEDLGGSTLIPGMEGNINLRYRFWIHIEYEVLIMREYIALAYYKLKGWI